MFRINNMSVEQMTLTSKMNEWSDYKLKRMKNSWAEIFRKKIMPYINEEEYSVLYSDTASRPNTPVNYMVGLLIIKSIMNLSDEELFDAAIFNEQVQYALGTLDCVNQPLSKNMVSNFRMRICEYENKTGINLFENTMRQLNDNLIELSKIDKSLKRADSLMISSACKKMSRTELIYKVNERLIKLLNKLNLNISDEFKNYLNEDNQVELLYRTKEEEIGGKLDMLLKHSITLYNEYKDNQLVNETEEFKQLQRLIEDQYDDKNNTPKSGKEIKPTSMQTPYDEDATYRYKYEGNVGYVGNVVEAVDTEKELALITDWDVAPNIKSDLQFMEEIIEKKKNTDADSKETYIVDAAYFSTDLNKIANENNIELHPTDMTGHNDATITNLDKFIVDENNAILECPNGNKPIKCIYRKAKDMIYADFDKCHCDNCPQKDICPIQIFKRKNKLSTSKAKIEMAKIRAARNTDEYKEISKLRSGIEGIPSLLRRKYSIDERPTKGLIYLRMSFSASILSINIRRLTKYENKPSKDTTILSNSTDFSELKNNIYNSIKNFISKYCFFLSTILIFLFTLT